MENSVLEHFLCPVQSICFGKPYEKEHSCRRGKELNSRLQTEREANASIWI
jgi:hypothetical protein